MSAPAREYKNKTYELKISRDGLFLFHLKSIASKEDENMEILAQKWQKYLSFLNAVYLLFESCFFEETHMAYFEISEITNKDALVYTTEEGMFRSMSIPTESYSAQYVSGRWLNSYQSGNPRYDWRIQARISVPLSIFDELNLLLDRVSKNINEVEILSELTKSLSEYKVGNYPISLVLSWFILETFIYKDWAKFLESKNETYKSGEKRISRKRMKNVFMDNRTYTVSVMLNILELNEKIDFQKYKRLDNLRDKRNKIVHRDSSVEVTAFDCQDALNLVVDYFEKYYDLKVNFNMSYSLTGI